MREEFIAYLDTFSHILPDGFRRKFRLEPLREKSAINAIEKPLLQALLVEPRLKDIIEEKDIKKIAYKVVSNLLKIHVQLFERKTEVITGEFVEPVQLQVVCLKLWEKDILTGKIKSEIDSIDFGDVDNALIDFYDNAVITAKKITKIPEYAIRKWCEEKLITSAGTRSLVYQDTKKTVGMSNKVVDILQNKYLIRAEERAGVKWFELIHDRLIKPIQISNEKWKKQYEKRKKIKILTIVIPSIISIGIIILTLFLWHMDQYDIPPVETISAGYLPYILSVDQNSGFIYVTNPKSDTITVINGKKNDFVKTINIADEPTDIVIDPKNNLLYVSHPMNKSISVIQGYNLMDVLNPFIKHTIRNIVLNYSPLSLGLDSEHSKLYVTSPNSVSVIDTNTNKVFKTIEVGFTPFEVFVEMKSNKLYVANSAGDTLSVINGTNYKILKTITVGKNPSSIAFNPNDNKVYVANKGDNTLSVINGTNYKF